GCEADPGSPTGAFICSQTHITTVCSPDTNPCTQDPACNPGTGLCTHPNEPNSTPCPDTDADACTTAGCESGSCVQNHISCILTPLHHMQCWEVRKQSFTTIPNVSLVDEFGSALVPVARPDRMCAPADKNDEDNAAPADPIHLMSYKIRAPFTRRDNQRVVNQ